MDSTRECLERLWRVAHRLKSHRLGPALDSKLVLQAMHAIEAEPSDSPYRDLLEPLHSLEEILVVRDAQSAKLGDASIPAEPLLRVYRLLSSVLGKEPNPNEKV
jgi:hypothetical protein